MSVTISIPMAKRVKLFSTKTPEFLDEAVNEFIEEIELRGGKAIDISFNVRSRASEVYPELYLVWIVYTEPMA